MLAFDEIDALQGESLRSVLRQLRDRHRSRPNPSPHSVILCGLRDVREAWQEEAIEMKVWRDRGKDPLTQGLAQLGAYLKKLGLDHGTLMLFDRRSDAQDIEMRTRFEHAVTEEGYEVLVLRA